MVAFFVCYYFFSYLFFLSLCSLGKFSSSNIKYSFYIILTDQAKTFQTFFFLLLFTYVKLFSMLK